MFIYSRPGITILGPNGDPAEMSIRIQGPNNDRSGGNGPAGAAPAAPSESDPSVLEGSFGFRVQGPMAGRPAQPARESGSDSASTGATTTPVVPPNVTPAAPESETTTGAPPVAPSVRPESQVRNPRVSVFADVIEDMERVQNDLRPHLTTIRQLLRDDPSIDPQSDEYRRAQHTYNQVGGATLIAVVFSVF